ncbi:MAG TPA: hypothetical protein P5313_06685 [Spirochaetia bacterium]|nr:hypothetical protein [Spirochaetales bacterium]HRY80082.1 hypothetical protein [Spirochaetia bacterium]
MNSSLLEDILAVQREERTGRILYGCLAGVVKDERNARTRGLTFALRNGPLPAIRGIVTGIAATFNFRLPVRALFGIEV